MPVSLTVTESYEMPGVPAKVAEQIFFQNVESSPSYVPHLHSVQVVRGQPPEVGSSWEERREYGTNGEIVLRKTVTRKSEQPFSVSAAMEILEGSWRLPRFQATFTVVIEPLDDANNDVTSSSDSCILHWTNAFLAVGILARVLATLCKPCLKRSLISDFRVRMRFYYEEALRRTIEMKTEINKEIVESMTEVADNPSE